jgi:hypothetical protein
MQGPIGIVEADWPIGQIAAAIIKLGITQAYELRNENDCSVEPGVTSPPRLT